MPRRDRSARWFVAAFTLASILFFIWVSTVWAQEAARGGEAIPVYRIIIQKNGVEFMWDRWTDMSRDECLERLKTFKPSVNARCAYRYELRTGT